MTERKDPGFIPHNPSEEEQEYNAWVRKMVGEGWVYGEEHDEELKRTPDLVPYQQFVADRTAHRAVRDAELAEAERLDAEAEAKRLADEKAYEEKLAAEKKLQDEQFEIERLRLEAEAKRLADLVPHDAPPAADLDAALGGAQPPAVEPSND